MTNIEKKFLIDRTRLEENNYFISLLQAVCSCGIITEEDAEKLQLQCVDFLADKCNRYTGGESSSIRVEVAENIMKSNLYTVGVYLKSIQDADNAAVKLKTNSFSDLYLKGRKIIDTKVKASKHIYLLLKDSKIDNPNYTYNATIDDNGLGLFFKTYNPDFEAHEAPGSIDYQLCNAIPDLTGIEFIQKYTSNLLLENQFCKCFDAKTIHHLLYGYDEKYEDLLVNIFEQVLTTALGCVIVEKDLFSLDIAEEDLDELYSKLDLSPDELSKTLHSACNELINMLDLSTASLNSYMRASLHKINMNFSNALKTNTLHKMFPPLVNQDILPKIMFDEGTKMDDEEYRKLIAELVSCRSSSDKLALLKEIIHSFSDMEDVLIDADFDINEMEMVLKILSEVELAALIRRHPIKSEIAAVDLSEPEIKLRSFLKNFMENLDRNTAKEILDIEKSLVEE